MLGRWTRSGSICPGSTISSTSTIVTRAAVAITGLKFRVVLRNTRLPQRSAFQALINAKSALSARSITYERPSNSRISLPSETTVPAPVGVKKAGMPAPPARMRSASVPCGFSSSTTLPLSTICSNSLFSPTYEPMCFLIWPVCKSLPRPKSSTPALLETVVRFLTPLRTRASIRSAGMPHNPNPPTMIMAPSFTSRMASSALATTLFINRKILTHSSLNQMPQQPLPFRPVAQTGFAVDVSRRADIDKAAAPGTRKLPGARDCQIRITAAGDDNRWKWKQVARDRCKILDLLGSVFAVDVWRRHQQRAFDLAGLARRGLAPVRQGDAAQAMRSKHNRRRGLLHLRCNALQPPLAMRKLPVPLLHAEKDRVLLLPQRLPVPRAGVLPARQHQHCCRYVFCAQLKTVGVIKFFTQCGCAQVLADMRQPLLQPRQRALDVRRVRVRDVSPH